MNSEFAEWLLAELEKRDWSMNRLAKKAGVHQSTISMVISGDRGPGLVLCQGIAKAFKLPTAFVFRKAGWLPDIPEGEKFINLGNDALTFADLEELAEALPPHRRVEFARYLLYLVQQEDNSDMPVQNMLDNVGNRRSTAANGNGTATASMPSDVPISTNEI